MDNKTFKVVFKKRLYTFVIYLVKTLDKLPKDSTTKIFVDQLIRSSTSILANYVEAQAASSRKDFTNFIHHSLKSANESKVWISILKDTKRLSEKDANYFLKEVTEIANILGSSIVTLKSKV
ncbi:hypothetical protein A2696_01550 [Candidatus Curtissbacteria bacterium RIFCSPHIGHO2_01_FULL_41_13]|uniref:Four helix bundle protein n=1 Tax=Candidatus Curtissbacteria bacterium RIFCSPHIGHO2_01_FULL_41_13 TaxID=1797745 RepID=A0A1F5FYH2_9BACT|nr:MAG: hypothetical protein A2696_01550 [Candidatus Curtissbacteria bacterium RIFCSPHIGHO2_01_FULL_41_13]